MGKGCHHTMPAEKRTFNSFKWSKISKGENGKVKSHKDLFQQTFKFFSLHFKILLGAADWSERADRNVLLHNSNKVHHMTVARPEVAAPRPEPSVVSRKFFADHGQIRRVTVLDCFCF
jgi:hypothetical protein